MSILDAKGKEKDAGAVATSTTESRVSNTPIDITTEADEENQQRGKVTGREIPLVESPSNSTINNITFNNTATTSSASVRAQIQPRQTEPGAVRVPGLDGENADDDEDSVTNTTVSRTSRVDPNNPVAELVDEDEENQRIQEKIDREVAAQRERHRTEQEGEIPEAEILIEKNHCSTRVKICSGVAVALLVALAIVLGTVIPRALQELAEPTEPPTPSPQEVRKELESFLSGASFDNGTALQAPSTPQNEALIWLANNTNLDTYSDEKKIQRYVLATLFYSTNGTSWEGNARWLSDSDECDWYNKGAGSCKKGATVELDLSSNGLFGTIPNELAFLSNSLGKRGIGIGCILFDEALTKCYSYVGS
jgi:hypothetical protein